MIMPTVKCTKQKVESVKSNRVNAIWFYFSKGVSGLFDGTALAGNIKFGR